MATTVVRSGCIPAAVVDSLAPTDSIPQLSKGPAAANGPPAGADSVLSLDSVAVPCVEPLMNAGDAEVFLFAELAARPETELLARRVATWRFAFCLVQRRCL